MKQNPIGFTLAFLIQSLLLMPFMFITGIAMDLFGYMRFWRLNYVFMECTDFVRDSLLYTMAFLEPGVREYINQSNHEELKAAIK